MSGTDDFLKAMESGAKMFNEGMTQLGTSMAIDDANKKIEQLNSDVNRGIRSKEEYDTVGKQIAQGLAMRLSKVAASPEHIASATQGLLPSAGAMAQIQGQERMNEKTIEKDKEIATKHNEMELEKARIMAGKGNAKQLQNMYNGFGKEFAAQNKDTFKKLDQLDSMLQTIDSSGKSPVGANLAQMEFVKQAVGRANWQEIQMGNPTASTKEQVARTLHIQLTNEDKADNAAFFKKLGLAERQAQLQKLDSAASGFAKAKARVLPDTKEADIYQSLSDQHIAKYGNSGSSAQAPNPNRKPIKKLYNPKTKQTKIIYDDGSEQITDGQ